MAAPAVRLERAGSNTTALMIVVAPLLAIAVLLISAAAISPGYVPSRRVAIGLDTHRVDLVMFGFGAAGVAFFVFFLQVLGP